MKFKLAWIVLGAILLLQVHPALATPAWGAKIDARIWQDLATGSFVPVIVRLADLPAISPQSPSGGNKAELRSADIDRRIRQTDDSQRGLRADLVARGVPYRSYWILNLVALSAGPELIQHLALRPDVVTIESDRAFRVPLETQISRPSLASGPESFQKTANLPLGVLGPEPGLVQVHAPDLWALGVRGQGTVVASADTGVAWDHPALKPHYRGWNGSVADHNYNWWDAIHTQIASTPNSCGYNLQVPCDDMGHGTHTTGTMVGDDNAGNQVGMAPGATWIACRNMDINDGRPSTYIECLQFFIAPTDLAGQNPDPGKRPDVIDNSYGCPPIEGCTSTSLHDAVLQVRAAGIFMSVAAGNSGQYGCTTITDPPATERAVFTVGAVDSFGNVASFSSRGPVFVNNAQYLKPDLVAPGVNVRSSYPPAGPVAGYIVWSGTSMAAPHVAGAVALLWSAFPLLRRDITSTEVLLRSSAVADPVSQACGSTPAGAVPNNTSGYGILNVLAAYNRWQSQLLPGRRAYFPVIIH